MSKRMVYGIMLTLLLIGMLTSTFNIQSVKTQSEGELLFFDDFNDGVADGWIVPLGNFGVIDGEYYTENDLGEKSITTVDGLTCTDCIIEVNLRFSGTEAGFRSGIVFRYTDNAHHYVLYVSAETTVAEFCMFTPQDTHWGHTIDGVLNRSVVINYNTDYLLRVCIQGDTFTGFLNGQKILSVTDGNYTSGQVGLRAQRSDIFFDNFTVYSIPKTVHVDDDNTSGPWDGTLEHPYQNITSGIEHALAGDTIYVRSGTYYENVVVNKSVSLVGENKETTIIDGDGTETVVHVVSRNVTIGGFKVQNGLYNGIYVTGWYSKIYASTVIQCGRGIELRDSYQSNVTENVLAHNGYGLYFWSCHSNKISGNNISMNDYGIHIAYSLFFTLRDNAMTENNHNLGIWSYGKAPYGSFYDFMHDIDTSNTVDGRPVYYRVNRHNEQIPEDAGYVGVINSTNITVKNLNLTNNGQGVLIAFSTNSTVQNVNVSNTVNGIRLVCSSFITIKDGILASNNHGIFDTLCSNNTIVGNQLLNNDNIGVAIANSNGSTIVTNLLQDNKYGIIIDGNPPFGGGMYNLVYHNNFVNNTCHVYPYTPIPSNNTWDNGCEGNYWSNYNGTDLDGDGIGDTYLSWEGLDNYPLMNPYWLPGDVNHDLKIDIYDVVRITGVYGSEQGDPNWNYHSDIAEPYGIIDIYDVVTCTKDYGKEYTP